MNGLKSLDFDPSMSREKLRHMAEQRLLLRERSYVCSEGIVRLKSNNAPVHPNDVVDAGYILPRQQRAEFQSHLNNLLVKFRKEIAA